MSLDKRSGLMVAVVLFLLITWVVGSLFYIVSHIEGAQMPDRELTPPGNATGGQMSPHQAVIKQFLVAGILSLVTLGAVGGFIAYFYENMGKLVFQAIVAFAAVGVFILILLLPIDICAFTTMPEQSVLREITPVGNGSEPDDPSQINILFPILLIVVPVIFLVVNQFWKAYSKREETPSIKLQVRDTIDRTLNELYTGKDVRSTIIRCYAEMSYYLEEKGVRERKFFTSREFRANALRKLSIDPRLLYNLTRMFEEARYSTHPLGKYEKRKAIENLESLKKELDEDNTGDSLR